MTSCCTRYIEVNCSLSRASLANAATSSFGIVFFMCLPLVRIIRFSSYLLQIAFDSCKNLICLEGVMAGGFQ